MQQPATRLIALSLVLLAGSAAAEPLEDFDFVHWSAGSEEPQLVVPDEERLAELVTRDDGAVDLMLNIEVDLRPEGDVVERITRQTRYLRRDEVANEGNAELSVNAYNEHLRVLAAYVIQTDGNRMDVDPATVQVTASDGDDIFSSYFDMVIPWPGLEPGATAVLMYERTLNAPGKIIPYSRVHYPQVLRPRLDYTLTARWTDGPGLDFHQSGELLDCRRDAQSFACVGNSIAAYDREDPDMNYFDALPQLAIAEPGDWADMRSIARDFVTQSLSADERIASTARRLTEGADTPEERLQRLHAFVSTQVRYVGLEHGERSMIPHPTALSLERRYGDCKDKTALYVDLAAALDLEVQPVLVSTVRNDPDKLTLPGLSYFDHMIACDPAGERCVDLTDPYSGFNTLSGLTQGSVSLPLDLPTDPMRLPADTYRWTLALDSENTIDRGGNFVERQRREYTRAWGAFHRASLAGLSRREIDDWLVEQYQGAAVGDAEPTVQVSGLDEINEPLEITTEVRFEELLDFAQTSYYTESPSWMNELLGFFPSDNEYHDLDFPGIRYIGTDTFRLPDNTKVTYTGPELEYISEFGRLTRRYEVIDNAVVVRTETALEAGIIPQSQLERFNQFLDTLSNESSIEFGYAPR